MESHKKIALGAFLNTLGGIGIFIHSMWGLTHVARVLDFLVGFSLGILMGLGCTLVLSGLYERRKKS